MGKKNLLVTLADETYLDAAKQVFSGAYFNAGWKGDYMLLAYKVPKEKLAWFREKGILVKECEPLVDDKVFGRWLSVILIKIYLFKLEFKKWNKIIYVDADTIIRASLDDLTKVKGFVAVWKGKNLGSLLRPLKFFSNTRYLRECKRLVIELNKNYKSNSLIFNSGLFVFDTNIVEKDTFSKLDNILHKYVFFTSNSDEIILNSFFYKKWMKLPLFYNVYIVEFLRLLYKFNFIKIDGIIIHFPASGVIGTNKPWSKNNPFYEEWKFNFDRADTLDLNKPYKNFRIFSDSEKVYWQNYYSKLYNLRIIDSLFDYLFTKPISLILRLIGHIGIFLKKNYPGLYYKLKKRLKQEF